MKILILLFASALSFQTPKAQINYLERYAGAYSISPDGAEAYTLKSDGTAIWVFGWMESGKVKTQQKSGSWTAQQGKIKIKINGNTGLIIEDYEFKGGKFRSVEDFSRSLIKR
jgi:hypothetical protein